MKTHPGALTSLTSSKAQTNDSDVPQEDSSSLSAIKTPAQQDEKQTGAAEKGDDTDAPPVGVGSEAAAEPMDTTVQRVTVVTVEWLQPVSKGS